jgi:probable F420-dependent oxidoreductase
MYANRFATPSNEPALRDVVQRADQLKIDAEVAVQDPAESAELAKKAEAFGFDCFWVNETRHDPFVQVALAASSTSTINVGTSIALAFTRSPTTLAYTAWDLQNISRGRLLLGLGSQVKGHIERRFGAQWESPAPKMKEIVLALRSIWRSWQDGTRLDFQGRFFHLDLMTPFFSPGPIKNPKIPIYVAGVNQAMCRIAGTVADGLHVHPLHTVEYPRRVIGPALTAGTDRAGRRRSDVSVAASVFAAVGSNSKEVAEMREFCREQVAFYASTRTYSKVLGLHGWEDVGERLHSLSTRGEWDKMPREVSDDMLEEFVVEGRWEEIGMTLGRRYDRLVDRVRLYLPFDGRRKWLSLVQGFRA